MFECSLVKGLVNFLEEVENPCDLFLGGTGASDYVFGMGGTNRSDKGLNLSGSWQQGHSAAYNTPSHI